MTAGTLRTWHSRRIAYYSLMVAAMAVIGISARAAFAGENQPPVITSFSVSNPLANYWVFQGVVDDENQGGCTVIFGGILEGYYTDCDQDGTFSLVVELGPSQEGVVTARAVDPYKLVSEVVEAPVLQ